MSAVALPATLESRLPDIAPLCARLGVARLELFGSAATGQFDDARSDYDFLVQLDPLAQGSRAQRLLELAETLESMLGARVDLADPRYIRNPYFAAEVQKSRRLIYG